MIVGVIALRYLPTLLNVDVDVEEDVKQYNPPIILAETNTGFQCHAIQKRSK